MTDRLSAADHTLFAGLLGVAFLLGCVPLYDTDLYWHLKTGQLILHTRSVPSTDWYTFTSADRPWIDLHWGYQVLLAVWHACTGVSGLVVLHAVLLTLITACGWWASGTKLPAILKLLPWSLGVIVLSGRDLRPEMFSLLFLAFTLYVLNRADDQPQQIWWLLPLQIVWLNMHALFILGIVVWCCWAGERLLLGLWSRYRNRAQTRPLSWRVLTGLTVILSGSSLLNPYGVQGSLFPFELYRKFSVDQAFYADRIGEFQRPWKFLLQHGFRNVYLNAEIVLWLITVISFVAVFWQTRQVRGYYVLLFAAFSHLAWEASRNANLFALVSAVVCVGNLQVLWTIRHGQQPVLVHLPRYQWGWGIVLILWMVSIPTNLWHVMAGEQKEFGWGERRAWYPHAAARFAGMSGLPPRAFCSHFGVASMYTYYHGPDKKVFMDGRLEVCTRAVFERFQRILMMMSVGDDRWQGELRDAEGRLPVVLLDSRYSREAINGLLQQPMMRLVYADSACAVFCERELAETLGMPTADYHPLLFPP
ncbi:MAG: hypothetical protein KatS3mg113_0028 [Planctomycetaceae bacterium]|nr:MAG: hypothetical protein KatS3mg113_0028 [Planctomycetaceae bacterium]